MLATYRATKFRQPTNAFGNIWGVHSFVNGDEKLIECVGELPKELVQEGMRLDLELAEVNHRKYGKQLKILAASPVRAPGREGTCAYLKQCQGVGDVLAERLYAEFGDGAIEELVQRPIEAASRIKGLSKPLARRASQTLEAATKIRKSTLPLRSLLANIGAPRDLADRIVKAGLWLDPVGHLEKNPFDLTACFGIGFRTADKLREKLGGKPDSFLRREAAAKSVLADSDSVWMHREELQREMSALLGFEVTDHHINQLRVQAQARVVGDHVALPQYEKEERLIGQYVASLAISFAKWPAPPLGLTEHQTTEVKKAFSGGRLAVLTGGPGTGKSFVTAAVARAFSGKVSACAPFAKAAQRLNDLLREAGVGIAARTAHSLLGAYPAEWGGGFNFAKNDRRPLDVDLLIVDEIQTASADLLLGILRALSPRTHLLLVGDANQLPPVGRGTFLRDWLELCKAPPDNLPAPPTYGSLTEVHRSAGVSNLVCRELAKGHWPPATSVYEPCSVLSPNLQMVASFSPAHARKEILRFMRRALRGTIRLPHGAADPIRDIQILVALNNAAQIGRKELNAALQDLLNPTGPTEHEIYRAGDKVICRKNMTAKLAGGTSEVAVANGTIGFVEKATPGRVTVQFVGASGPVNVLVGAGRGPLDLAYAITTHAAIGSEFPVTLVALTGSAAERRIVDRHWLVTALSRHQHACVLASNNGACAALAQKDSAGERISHLQKAIIERMRG